MGTLTIGENTLLCSLAYGDNDEGRCSWCGAFCPKGRKRWCSSWCNEEFRINHWLTAARHHARNTKGRACERCGADGEVELNHKAPKGGHAMKNSGCQHHQDNLELLCPPCHAETTKQQKKAGPQMVLM